jgi:EAL domain-containing protein (putative c-di-GMP-specific phosphodiesterase class I)
MPLAEETGTAVRIGRFALEHAVAQLASWRTFKPGTRLSLGISARQARDANLASVVSEVIRRHEIEPSAISLEIPESAVGEDPDAAIAAFGALKATGVNIALGDFGRGGSSLSHVTKLPIDALKIHESFVRALGDSEAAASIVLALIQLGHALGLGVVADGVETRAQLEQLRALRCDAAQGGLIGPPLSAEQVEALLVAEVA